MIYGRWKNNEIVLLKSIYRVKSKKHIVETLDRKWKGIVGKANRLGLYHERSADSVNIEYFDNWSNNMAYLLGFIAADGCLIDSPNNIGLQIHLSKKDLAHLTKIKDEIDYKGCISISDISCKLSICSKYLYNKLIDRGIYPRKSINLKFPYIPDNYLSHFIRGYFDGDGCIGNYFHKGNKSKTWYSCFVGTFDFLDTLCCMANKYCDTRLVNVRKITNKNIYSINYSVKDTIKLTNWLYKDSTIHLDRKYEKIEQLLRERN